MPSIINATTTNGVAISPDNSGELRLQTNNGTTAMTITTGQNVGIGTTSPGAKLSLTSTGNTTADGVRLTFGSEARSHNIYSDLTTGRDLLIAPYRAVTLKAGTGTTEGEVRLQSYESTIISTGSSYTERMRIDSSGRITTPNQPSFLVTQGNTSYQNQTITYGTVISNIGSHYNTGTGRFTAPVAGTYLFFAQTYPNGGQLDLSLRVNSPATITIHGRGQNAATVHISAIFTLAANDFVYVVTSGVPAYSDGSNWGYFGGHLIG